jgi:hypothetical protein
VRDHGDENEQRDSHGSARAQRWFQNPSGPAEAGHYISVAISEPDLHAELELACVGRGGLNPSERARRQIGDRHAQVHAIEDVETFNAKFHRFVAAERDMLDERQIRVLIIPGPRTELRGLFPD